MTLVQKSPKHIYIAKEEVVSDMQGPCDDGFHVPTKSEWDNVLSYGTTMGAWTSSTGNYLRAYLKIPFMGERSIDYPYNGRVANTSYGYYWTCSNYSNSSAYLTFLSVSDGCSTTDFIKSNGCPIRAFKNTAVIPDSNWTVSYQGTGTAGIYWNSDLGLISISADGTNWITMQDKNVGATTVYSSGTAEDSGGYFQRGNNYMFAYSGTVTTSSTTVDASSYGPGNYYSGDTFILGYNGWDSSNNDNLRGGVTGVIQIPDTDIKAVYLGTTKVRPTTSPIAPVNETFSYTGSDQTWTVPYTQDYIITCKGAGSRSAAGGLAQGTITLTAGDTLSIMVGATGYNGNGTKYGFGGSANGGSNAAGGGLSGVFTGSGTITASDSARALVIGGGAGGSSAGTGGVGGGTTGGTGTGSYGTAGAGGTQSGRGSGGNAGSYQFDGGNGSGTYGYGGGGGWRGGNGSIGDGSGDDDKGGGGGSGYVISTATDITLTAGGGASAGGDGSVTIVSVYQTSTTDVITEQTAQNAETSSSYYYGVKFTALNDGEIKKINFLMASTGVVGIINSDNQVTTINITNASSCELSTPYSIEGGKSYFIGIKRTSGYIGLVTGLTYPINGNAVNYIQGQYGGGYNGNVYTDRVWGIKSLEIGH